MQSARTRKPASYLYFAATPVGGRKAGVRVAAGPHALAANLRQDRLLLLNSWRLPVSLGDSRALPLKDLAGVNDVLAQLLTRGVPLVEALDTTTQTVSPRLSPRIAQVREKVAAGTSFADACDQTGMIDRVTTAVYRAAEKSGDLGGAASQLATTARRQLAVQEKALTVMMYPAIVTTLSVLIAFGMMTFVVPTIGEQLEDAGADIPLFTQGIVGIGRFSRDNLLWVGIVFGLLLTVAIILRAGVVGFVLGLARKMPAVRELVVAQESARFFTVMAAMSRSGVTLADSLSIGALAISHPRMRRELGTLRTRLVEGGSLPTLIDSVSSLPIAARRLLVAAERSGEMDSAFETLSEDMVREVERRSARLLAALEPALIVLMFLLIGTIILSIMIPLLTIVGSVK